MHVEYCLVMSNTIVFDMAEYMFIFDGLQNFHYSRLGFRFLKKENIFLEK